MVVGFENLDLVLKNCFAASVGLREDNQMSSSIECVQTFWKIVIGTEVGTFLCTEDWRF